MDPLDPEQFDDVVHQAEGVLAARLGVSVDQAAMILLVRAESRGLSLGWIADEVLAPQLAAPSDPNIAGTC
ncbi:ANTAR domain-containing protein [Actinomycetospora sp. CA-053990]|uniref:ANTAR domain-containing protein n=1 Tax=Actinomycetospora sp. CA-053990 TaxID=3239891 RepID=UPI003D8A2ABE